MSLFNLSVLSGSLSKSPNIAINFIKIFGIYQILVFIPKLNEIKPISWFVDIGSSSAILYSPDGISIFSINSPDHAAFLVKATGGQSGKASICAYSFLQQRCECQSSGVNGVNGTIINGNGSESKGLLLQSNGVNVAQITLKW